MEQGDGSQKGKRLGLVELAGIVSGVTAGLWLLRLLGLRRRRAMEHPEFIIISKPPEPPKPPHG